MILKAFAIASPVNDVQCRVQDGRRIAGVKPLLDADRCRQPIGAVQRRLMAGRAAHIGVDRDARIEEKHSTEISACLCDRKFSRAHVLRKRAENLLRLFQRNRVALVSGSNSGREHYYRHDGHTQTFHGCLRLR